LVKDKNLGGVCGFMGLYFNKEHHDNKKKKKRKKCKANYENF
jgi:hypothetical protein